MLFGRATGTEMRGRLAAGEFVAAAGLDAVADHAATDGEQHATRRARLGLDWLDCCGEPEGAWGGLPGVDPTAVLAQCLQMLTLAYHRYREAFAGLPRELWVLALVMWVNRSGAMVLAYLTLYLTSEIGIASSHAGHMISVFGVGSIIGSFVGGRLVHRLGAVRVQTMAMLLSVPCYWMMPLWREPWMIAANLLALSVLTESVRPANATVVAKVTQGAERTRAFALTRLAANLGFAIGGAVGGLLASIDFRLLFWVDGATTLAAACILLWFFGMRRLPGEELRPANLDTGPLGDRSFVTFLGLFLLTCVVFFQFISTYTLYLRDHYHLTELLIGTLFAVNTLVIVAVEMVLVDYAKRWPLVRTVGWGCVLTCLGFGMLPFGSSYAFAVLAILVMTAGEMLSMPLAVGYMANCAPPGQEGRYIGWWATGVAVAFVVGPLVGGTLYGIQPELVWYASLAVCVMVGLGFAMLPEAERTPGQSTRAAAELSPSAVDPEELVAESAP